MGENIAATGFAVTAAEDAVSRLAAAILVNDDHVLIVRRSITEHFLPGVWGVPCGKVNPGEEPCKAAVRELMEETGLTGEVLRKVGHSEFMSKWKGALVRNVQSNFLMRLEQSSGEIRLPLDDQEARWVHVEAIAKFPGLDKYNRGVIGQRISEIPATL